MIRTGLAKSDAPPARRLMVPQRLIFVTEFTLRSLVWRLMSDRSDLSSTGEAVNQRHKPCTEAKTPGTANE
jgi:hypothetical protein